MKKFINCIIKILKNKCKTFNFSFLNLCSHVQKYFDLTQKTSVFDDYGKRFQIKSYNIYNKGMLSNPSFI